MKMHGYRFVRGAWTIVAGLFFAVSAIAAPEILVLSNRADLISGGDALVEIKWPAGTDTTTAQVALNGVSVKSSFVLRGGRYMGLVTGLNNGDNMLTAQVPGAAAQIIITNHPITGPILSGPHITPYECRAGQYNQGAQGVDSALSDRELSRGFAYLNSTELWNNQHANPHLQGETLMMLKEAFIEHIGIPKWTVGVGGSGGSIQQYLIAQLFPGLLDGLQPSISFPETLMPNVFECRLANTVFQSDPVRWTTAKQVAIQGFNAGTCNAWDGPFASALVRADATAIGSMR